MALTLVEGAKYSTDVLQRTLIDRLVKDSPILEKMPFKEILGNSLIYDTITTDSTAAFYSPNENWSEDVPSVTQASATLAILGGDADTDNFIITTRSDHMDVQAEITNNKMKAVRNTYLDTFYYGDTTANAKAFNGLQKLIASTTYNTVHAGATGTGDPLSMAKLYEAIDLVRGGKPDLLVMSRKMRRGIQVYMDSVGDHMPQERNAFGQMVQYFAGIPIAVDDNISDVETASASAYSAKTGSDCTTIFILRFEPTAVCGLQAGGGLTYKLFPDLPDKDGSRVRIRWYCSLMLQDLRSCAKVDGIESGSAVTA